MAVQPILIGDRWQAADARETFCAFDPATGEQLADLFPVSSWNDCERALAAATVAAAELRAGDSRRVAAFLDGYADRIKIHAEPIVAAANRETALPLEPRLRNVELPRTVNQLRQAAAAVREGSWMTPTVDTAENIRSCYGPLGPVATLGPNNFPLAFNGVAGGDFAAAIAAGNPVIAKAHPAHPRTTQLLAEQALEASCEAGLPSGAVQMLYHIAPEDGERLAADSRLGAMAFTGSRGAGMRLKACADAAGKPIYLEMSSVNPVFFLPGAVMSRRTELVAELAGSCLMGSGQFCTSPNLFVLCAGDDAEKCLAELRDQLAERAPQPLLALGVLQGLKKTVETLRAAGAEVVTGGEAVEGNGYYFQNTLLRVSAQKFCESPERLQTEAFGNATLAVVAANLQEAIEVASLIEGSLTGTIYSALDGADDAAYAALADILRWRVGRLLNDKMPTGVAVSAAMNHGGPYPATGHPGFTAVGMPASIRRFAMLQCFDRVREERLPPCLRDDPPHEEMWRLIDGAWRRDSFMAARPEAP